MIRTTRNLTLFITSSPTFVGFFVYGMMVKFDYQSKVYKINMVLPTGNRSHKMVFSDKPSFTKNDLYDRLWTKTLIDVFLKDYDSVEFSNHIGWPRYLYDKKRVLSIEDSFEFKEALTKSIKRRGFSNRIRQELLKENRIISDLL